MTLSSFVLPHVIAGTLALLLFWTAAFNRKGTALHRRIGQAYLLSMTVIVLTGIPLTLKAYMLGNYTSTLFLGFLFILVSHSCLTSGGALCHRQHREAFPGPVHRIAAGILGAAAAAVIIMGASSSMAAILVPFGCIGVISMIALIRDIRAQEASRNWWLKEHYGAMIGNGIATHIAFSQIGLSRVLPGQGELSSMLGWLLPLIIGLAAVTWLNRRYQAPGAKMPAGTKPIPSLDS